MRSVRDLLKLAVVVVVAVVLLVIIMNAAINPFKNASQEYTADFTDVSGLRPNGDVRIRGVQIGKIRDIAIVRDGGQAIARVRFTASDGHRLTSNSTLAIKYQNLTGIRYLDVTPGDPGDPVSHIGIDHTKPSFDITALFNGLQPVLNTLDTDQINEISENALTLLNGDGSGLKPLLQSIQTLGTYASDREQIISTLVANLSRISQSFGGKADDIIDILHSLEVPIDAAIGVLDEFIKTSVLGPQFMGPIASIVRHLGLSPDMDFNKVIETNFGSADAFANALRLVPGIVGMLNSPTVGIGHSADLTCSHGPAPLPADVTMLLNGNQVTVCRA